MKSKIIFIGGIHGVGKTTFCQNLSFNLDMHHFSSSKLIADERENADQPIKNVFDVDKNQELLLRGLSKVLKRDDRWYLIDGHFCLLDYDNQVVDIPLNVFKSIHPKAIVVIFDEPKNIQKRLEKRDGVRYELNFLASFQEREICYGNYVAEVLQIPHFFSNLLENGKQRITDFIKELTF